MILFAQMRYAFLKCNTLCGNPEQWNERRYEFSTYLYLSQRH